MLSLKERRARKAVWPADLKSQIADLKSTAESCSRQLRGWADSLQNSDIKGQRHLNRRTREQDEQTKKSSSRGHPAKHSLSPDTRQLRQPGSPHPSGRGAGLSRWPAARAARSEISHQLSEIVGSH